MKTSNYIGLTLWIIVFIFALFRGFTERPDYAWDYWTAVVVLIIGLFLL